MVLCAACICLQNLIKHVTIDKFPNEFHPTFPALVINLVPVRSLVNSSENKKALLCEHKRRTAHRVTSACSTALSWEGGGYSHPVLIEGRYPYPVLMGVSPCQPDGGTPISWMRVPRRV